MRSPLGLSASSNFPALKTCTSVLILLLDLWLLSKTGINSPNSLLGVILHVNYQDLLNLQNGHSSKAARAHFLKAASLEVSPHLQIAVTCAVGEPLHMGSMKLLTGRYNYKGVAANNIWALPVLKDVSASSMYPRNDWPWDFTTWGRKKAQVADFNQSICSPSFSPYPFLSNTEYWDPFIDWAIEGQILSSLIPVQAHRSHYGWNGPADWLLLWAWSRHFSAYAKPQQRDFG